VRMFHHGQEQETLRQQAGYTLAISTRITKTVGNREESIYTLRCWHILPGLFFATGYLVSLNATFMRVRMHLYEVVVAEALERRQSRP
jgi:hypothetical protein